MAKQGVGLMEKVNEIEKNLQSLKVEYFLNLPKKTKKEIQVYKEKDIIKEVKKIRKDLWNEKYSKAI